MKRPTLLRAPGLTVEQIVNGHLPQQFAQDDHALERMIADPDGYYRDAMADARDLRERDEQFRREVRRVPPRYGRGPSPAIGFVLLVLAAFAVVAVLYGLILGVEAIGATSESVQAGYGWRWGRM